MPYWVRDNPKYTRIKREKTDAEKSLEKAIKDVVIRARSSGGEVQGLAESIAAGHNAICTPINYKSEASIKRKVLLERKEKGGAYMPDKLKDLVRTTIIADRRNIDIVIEQLRMSEPVKAFKGIAVKKQRPQNHLGYSGNIVNLQASNGLVAEVQVNL